VEQSRLRAVWLGNRGARDGGLPVRPSSPAWVRTLGCRWHPQACAQVTGAAGSHGSDGFRDERLDGGRGVAYIAERAEQPTGQEDREDNQAGQPAAEHAEGVAVYLNCRGRGAIPNRRHALPSLQGGADGRGPFRRAGPAHTARPVGRRAAATLGSRGTSIQGPERA